VTPYTRTMLDATSDSSNAQSLPAAAVLDPACLDQLRALDPQGGAFFIRVLSTFLKSLDVQHDAVMSGVASSDWQAVSHAAHSLKSASASVGALVLSRLCAAIEDAVRQGQNAQVPSMAQTFTAEVARVRDAVGALQGSAAP
jgi:histidine phosphotransfer protein HptB